MENLNVMNDDLAMPGAENVITAPIETDELSLNEELEASSSQEESEVEEEESSETFDIPIGAEDGFDESNENEGAESKSSRSNKTIKLFKTLIDKGVILPFDDDKPLEEYTEDDWLELLNQNFEEKKKEAEEEFQKEFFSQLPVEMQMALKYVFDGGTDLTNLFKALSQSREIQQLDLSHPENHEHIVRAYLQAKNFGSADEIEEQIEEWKDMGVLDKKAAKFKPFLDDMQEELIQQKLKQQEEFKKQQITLRKNYIDNVASVLKTGELNGIKIDRNRQKMLFEELTTTKYMSMTGRPTNLFGKLLEDYQFSDKPRFDLIAEALWLLADPDAYKDAIRKQGESKAAERIVRQLKTEQSNKGAFTTDVRVANNERRGLKRPKSIFGD